MKLQARLRDLFWVILVAAVATSWGIDRFRLTQRIKSLEPAWVENSGMRTITGVATICCGFDTLAEDSSKLAETDEECPNPAAFNERDRLANSTVGS